MKIKSITTTNNIRKEERSKMVDIENENPCYEEDIRYEELVWRLFLGACCLLNAESVKDRK